jgi:hypothetical protein
VLVTEMDRVTGEEPMKSGVVLAVALAGLCGSAFADDTGPFIYGSFGEAHADFHGKSSDDSRISGQYGGANVLSSVKSDPTIYKLNLGYQFGTSLGVQFGYGSTSSINYSTSAPVTAQASEQLRIWDALIGASHDFGSGVMLTVRGGVAYVRVAGSGTIAHFSGSATQPAAGVGVKYVIDSHLSARLDWDSFRAPGGSQIGQVNLFSAGIGYKF